MSLLSPFLMKNKRWRKSESFDSLLRQRLRQVERWIKFGISRPLGFLLKPKSFLQRVELSSIRSILILRYDALGDAVLSTPIWRSIRKYAPHIRIGVAGSVKNWQLLKSDPDIDDVFLFSKAFRIKTIFELFRARQKQYDVVLNLFFLDKTRGAIYSRIAAPKAITSTIVRDHHDKYRALYSIVGNRPPLHPGTQMLLQNVQVLEQVLDITLSETDLHPTIFVKPEIEQAVLAQIHSKNNQDARYILINTDASQAFREWGLTNNFELSIALKKRHPSLQVFWTCSPERHKIVQEFLTSQPISIPLLDTPTIQHLAAAVKLATAVVSPDTSVIHFASAFNKPVVGFYLDQTEFLPYGVPYRALYPPDGRTASLTTVQSVLDAVTELLTNNTNDTLL